MDAKDYILEVISALSAINTESSRECSEAAAEYIEAAKEDAAAAMLWLEENGVSAFRSRIAKLEAQLENLAENYRTCCMVNDNLLHNAEVLMHELKTAKRDAILVDSLINYANTIGKNDNKL